MNILSLDELYEKSKNLEEGEVILDVRGPDEFAAGHIEGSLNIPHDSVIDHTDKLKEYKNIFMKTNTSCFALGGEFAINESKWGQYFDEDYRIWLFKNFAHIYLSSIYLNINF